MRGKEKSRIQGNPKTTAWGGPNVSWGRPSQDHSSRSSGELIVGMKIKRCYQDRREIHWDWDSDGASSTTWWGLGSREKRMPKICTGLGNVQGNSRLSPFD